MKIIMTRGIPGSGKSTWAKQAVLDAKPGEWIRINRDDLRAMLHAGRFVQGVTEHQIVALRNALIEAAFISGAKVVVVDDTNLTERHENELRHIANKIKVGFEVNYFPISIEEAVERDSYREGTACVGEDVIRKCAATLAKTLKTVDL